MNIGDRIQYDSTKSVGKLNADGTATITETPIRYTAVIQSIYNESCIVVLDNPPDKDYPIRYLSTVTGEVNAR